MSELSQGEETALLELVGPVFPRRSWLSGRQSVDIPAGDEQSCWVAHLATAPAGARLSLVPAAEWGGRMESDAAVEFFRTRCQPCRVRLVFTGILAGETEGGWDAVVMGPIRITDPVRFIEECGSRLVSVGVPVTIQLLGAWLVKRWAVTVGDWVRAAGEGFLAVEFREKGVLPAAVWTHRFNEWLADAGMEVAFEEVQWENAEAAGAAESSAARP